MSKKGSKSKSKGKKPPLKKTTKEVAMVTPLIGGDKGYHEMGLEAPDAPLDPPSEKPGSGKGKAKPKPEKRAASKSKKKKGK